MKYLIFNVFIFPRFAEKWLGRCLKNSLRNLVCDSVDFCMILFSTLFTFGFLGNLLEEAGLFGSWNNLSFLKNTILSCPYPALGCNRLFSLCLAFFPHISVLCEVLFQFWSYPLVLTRITKNNTSKYLLVKDDVSIHF